MSLLPLASLSDLSARGVAVAEAEEVIAETMLAAASEAVREAAGSAISEETSTVTLMGASGALLRLPSVPVRAVQAVSVNGEPVTDFTLTGDSLWRAGGWCGDGRPAAITVTFTHGFQTVPEDIVNLVCMFAIAGMHEASQGSRAGLAYESIDDYRVGYQQGAEATASAIEVPERTARMLRARFGGGTYVTSVAT